MYRYLIYCRKSTEDDDHQAISLESQHRELLKYAEQHNLTVADTFFEKRSARTTGRPIFSHLMQRIAKGDAQGILAWHPDRLSRNAVDGGLVIHYLDQGKLKDLQFPTFTFENSPQGKFMLMIIFGHSKYQVDSLSEIVKRGNRTKREIGWLPGTPPIGYLNIRGQSGMKIIGRDPERFPRIQELWTLFLSGGYSGLDLMDKVAEWDLRTRRTWRIGGKRLVTSGLYRILRNPFYAGHIVYQGIWYQGRHEPMITLADFNRAQQLLRGRRIHAHRYRFRYSRLLTCGNCGGTVTAEHHVNRYGYEYTYYHCSRSKQEQRSEDCWQQDCPGVQPLRGQHVFRGEMPGWLARGSCARLIAVVAHSTNGTLRSSLEQWLRRPGRKRQKAKRL